MKLTQPWSRLAAGYQVIGDQQAVDRVVRLHPAAVSDMGDLYAAMQEWDAAIAVHRNALTNRPSDPALLATLAMTYQAAGRTREAVPLLAAASSANPKDTLLTLQVAALQAWFGQDKELADTCDMSLALAKATDDVQVADRVAKICSLRSSDARRHAAALVLARRAVDRGQGHRSLPYFQMALGMAEYRSGHFVMADAALVAAMDIAEGNPRVVGTSAFYRAMSLLRGGKPVEGRALASAAAAKMKPLPPDEQNPLAGAANADDLILWLAYKEAKAMIHFDAAPAAGAPRDAK
jgi:Flp pilus assembly protein TadD